MNTFVRGGSYVLHVLGGGAFLELEALDFLLEKIESGELDSVIELN